MKAEILFNDGNLYNLDSQVKRIYTVGRSAACSISGFKDLAVSNRHATLYFNDNNCWQITDGDLDTNKASRGGIRINKVKLNPDFAEELNHQDLVELSTSTSFQFFSTNEREESDGDTTI